MVNKYSAGQQCGTEQFAGADISKGVLGAAQMPKPSISFGVTARERPESDKLVQL